MQLLFLIPTSKWYNIMYRLGLAHKKAQADIILAKAKEALDALFVEYSIMRSDNIQTPTSTTQPPLDDGKKAQEMMG